VLKLKVDFCFGIRSERNRIAQMQLRVIRGHSRCKKPCPRMHPHRTPPYLTRLEGVRGHPTAAAKRWLVTDTTTAPANIPAFLFAKPKWIKSETQ
jgi:hypothetical protein